MIPFKVLFLTLVSFVLFVSCEDTSFGKDESTVNNSFLPDIGPHVEAPRLKEGIITSSDFSQNFRATVSPARAWTIHQNESTTWQPTTQAPAFQNMSEVELVHAEWEKFEKSMKKSIDGYTKKALPMLLKMGSDAKLSEECQNSIMTVVQGIRGMKSWAFRMLDASSKFPSGILDGSLTGLGEYDQCLEIVKLDSNKRTQFTGQYCVLEAKPLLPPMPHRLQVKNAVLNFSNFSEPDSVLADVSSYINTFYAFSLRLGLCLPSGCSVNDIQKIANLSLKEIPITATVLRCEGKEPLHFTNLQIGATCIIGIFVLLVVIGTYLETREEQVLLGTFGESMKCFSVNKNLSNLLKIKQSKENFGVVNGMRVLSIAWVILMHTYSLSYMQIYSRQRNAKTAYDDVTTMTIFNGWLVVETFFVLGAFLVSYYTLRALDAEKGRFNFAGYYYLHRIWRLIPPLGGVLLVMFLLPLLGSGPVWKDVIGKEAGNCEKNWWQVLIIPLNSWTHYDDMCLLHTWYLAVDLQLYCVAPIILIPLYRWPVVGFLVMIFLTLCCMGIVAALTIIYDFYPTTLCFTPDLKFTKFITDMIHFKPYSHMGSYCIGLALGYLILNHRKKEIKLIFQFMGWCAAIVCSLSALYGAFEWNRGNLPSKIVEVSYAMFHRTGFAFGIAWCMYMCISERGGLVNRFLSWDFFIPLSKLSYSQYIIHLPILWVRNGISKEPKRFQHYHIVYEFLGTYTLSLCLSLVFYLMFEAALPNLEKVWFTKKDKRNEEKINLVEKTGHDQRVYN